MPNSSPSELPLPELPQTRRLLTAIGRRQRLSRWARRWYVSVMVAAGLFAFLLLLCRLTGALPDLFSPMTLLAIPLVAAMAALLLCPRVSALQAARVADRHGATHDLFLTVCRLARSAGEFQPLVCDRAEAAAPQVEAAKAVTWSWQRPALYVVSALLALLAAVLWLPQFDPYGQVAARTRAGERKQRLADSRKATKLRLAELREAPDSELSAPTKAAFEELKQTFAKLDTRDRNANATALRTQQEQLAELWRRGRREQLKSALRNGANQAFGSRGSRQQGNWQQGLKSGDLSPLRESLQQMHELASKLAAAKDPLARQRLAADLRQQLQEVADFAKREIGSAQLQAALDRALEQLDAADLQGGSEGAEALRESLELAKAEAGQVQQAINDMQAIQDALEALQLAKALNRRSGLDEAPPGLDGKGLSMTEYAQLFKQWLGDAGQGAGGQGNGGMGDEGQGRGGRAPEDPWATTDFKTEKSQSQIQAGKMLMDWKQREVAESGRVSDTYREQLRQVQQGVSEAILQERVPSGYHEAIKRYFDTLSAPATAAPAP